MDQKMSYADVLTRIMREEEKYQPLHGPVIVSVCDQETGQFMLVAVGWQKERHIDSILFHARLVDGLVVIETDKTEEGLKPLFIEAGIRAEDIALGRDYGQPERAQIAA